VVAEGAGRVVKMIGDEIMFTVGDDVTAAEIALRLVEEVGDRDGLPALRAGVAAGPVVLRHGDVYGAPANLAHRLVDVARPGTVVVDQGIADALEDRPDVEATRIHGIRRLRGFDKVRAFALRRQAT
jgi:adenylate cyclase